MGRRNYSYEEMTGLLRTEYGDTVTRQEMLLFQSKHGKFPYWITDDKTNSLGGGRWKVPPAGTYSDNPVVEKEAAMSIGTTEVAEEAVAPAKTIPFPKSTLNARQQDLNDRTEEVRRQASIIAYIPSVDKTYVPFGDYGFVRSIIKSKKFAPVFITGLSGNGKTKSVQQACAELGVEFVIADVTIETDEDDLIGGYRLKDGNTVFELGPISVAAIRGCPIVLNEIDCASAKIMCLQRILEGEPFLIKKLGMMIHPQTGFNIFATANTKGRGSEDGKFIGTGLLNEAFLDRFYTTIEQEYPETAIEERILKLKYESLGGKVNNTKMTFIKTIAKWADSIRKTYREGGCDDLIATRRLLHIMSMYYIFEADHGEVNAQEKALSMCINRFDEKTKDSFIDLYNKLAPDASPKSNTGHDFDGKDVTDPSF